MGRWVGRGGPARTVLACEAHHRPPRPGRKGPGRHELRSRGAGEGTRSAGRRDGKGPGQSVPILAGRRAAKAAKAGPLEWVKYTCNEPRLSIFGRNCYRGRAE